MCGLDRLADEVYTTLLTLIVEVSAVETKLYVIMGLCQLDINCSAVVTAEQDRLHSNYSNILRINTK